MLADHGLCDKKNDPWFHRPKIDVGFDPDGGKWPVGWCCAGPNAGSFHPTQVGQCAYEHEFERVIAKNQPQIMATDPSTPPPGCDGGRDAQRARLHDYGGKIRDGLLALAAAVL